jgi:hypothetical protein
MQESFLHYLWQMQYFSKKDLATTEGESIEVFSQGMLNTNSGPDFSNARIKIGEIAWFGSVEIHLNASTWFDHHHEQDRSYDNVILHVVWHNDKSVSRRDLTPMPTLELRSRVDESLIRSYRQLISSSFAIPCQQSLPSVSSVARISMIDRVMMVRLERKAMEVLKLYEQNDNSWDETFYQLLARNFGFKVNGDPLFQLARLLPLKLLLKQGDKLEHMEALMLGQAGFLESPRGDEHFTMLRREHRLLAQKFSIHDRCMSKSQWRFLRLRPANFPTLRLAQLATLLHRQQSLFSRIIECESVPVLMEMFQCRPSEYWLHHFQFNKKADAHEHMLGASSISNIIINTVVPVLVAYGRQNDQQNLVDRAVQFLQKLPGEENKITRTWNDLGVETNSSFDSQAVIELYNNFCSKKECLNCTIGSSLMRPE